MGLFVKELLMINNLHTIYPESQKKLIQVKTYSASQKTQIAKCEPQNLKRYITKY